MEGNEIKPARAAPPKPAPFHPQRPPPSSVPPVLPSAHTTTSNGVPPKPGRKPPPSVPPPPPPRVDLGETPGEVVSSIKEQSNDDVGKKGSPKLKPKRRPEITIVSAKPMDSSEVIPPPSAPSQPAPVCEVPNVPQKPVRKSKGREPPPRPKSRPVSELTLETGALDKALVGGEGKSSQAVPDEEEREKTSNNSALKNAPVVPVRKTRKNEDSDFSKEKDSMEVSSTQEEQVELCNHRAENKVIKEVESVKKVAPKPTVFESKPTENDSSFSAEVDDVKETKSDNPDVPVLDSAAAGKKSKPTVIVAKPPKRTTLPSQGTEDKHETEQQKEEKPTPLSSQGGKPPPPAKKPKPAVKPKPFSSVETPSEEPTEEKNLDSVVATKPKPSPTVILAAKLPKTETPKPSDTQYAKEKEESQTQVKPSKPTVILPVKPPNVSKAPKTDSKSTRDDEEEKVQVKPALAESAGNVQEGGKDQKQEIAPQTVKPKRVPTVIRAPRPDGQDSNEGRKPPKRPQRGPSVRKPAPPRPVSAPAEEDKEQDKLITRTREESNTDDSVEKKAKPQRPVSMPGFKGNEVTAGAKKFHETESPDEAETTLIRKGSKKRLPAPRPPTVEHVKGEKEPTPEQVSDEKTNEKHRPPPPRPRAVEPAKGEVEPTLETSDKNQDRDDKSKGKTKPPRPSSRVVDNETSKHLPKETGEGHVDDKPKPARPAPVALKGHATSRNVADTKTVGESSAGDHVKGTSGGRDSADHEKKSSKTKPKPPRPTSASFSSKGKPHRPSGPTAKLSKKTKEEAVPTQVSSVCETYIEPSAVALYDYEPSAIDDLAFSAGDEIVLVKRIDDEWYVGRLGDQQGMFPAKFVEIIEDLPRETAQQTQAATAPSSSPFDVMALHDFHGNERDGELVFNAGEMIHVVEKINDDWLRGEYHGRTGAFPCNFVDISTDVVNKLPLSAERNVVANKSDQASSDSGRDLHCKALFDYHSDEPDDLSFNAGDVIKVRKKIGDEWIEGELNGRTGMFPVAYVEMAEDAQGSQPEETKNTTVDYGTALYDFTGSAADELSFKKGDRIEITEIVSDDWLKGRLGGHQGMFPRTFIQLSKESVRVPQPVKKVLRDTPKAKALFDFDGEFDDELSFKVNDVIVLLERVNEEWFRGEIDNRVGRFPTAFVKILSPLP